MKKELKLSNEETNKLTKEALQISLLKLLKEKNINDINVTEIVKIAGVSRTAFYRNYKTKESIILDLYNSILIYLKDKSINEKYDNNHLQFFYDILSKIKENPIGFKILLNVELSKESQEKLETFLFNNYQLKNNTDKYKLMAIISALKTVLIKWIDNNMNDDINEIANLCNTLTKSI